MFSGIVEETGSVHMIITRKNLSVLRVRARKAVKSTKPGDSIAVNGVCLTVTSIKKNLLSFDLMKETLSMTTLGCLNDKDKVNLERALKANDRIDGHFVTGHVDTVALVKKRIDHINYCEVRIGLASRLRKYIIPKGSVCIDGVSLTVGDVKSGWFSVYLIPFTKKMTTLGNLAKGARVNVETDILAKYVLNKPISVQ